MRQLKETLNTKGAQYFTCRYFCKKQKFLFLLKYSYKNGFNGFLIFTYYYKRTLQWSRGGSKRYVKQLRRRANSNYLL